MKNASSAAFYRQADGPRREQKKQRKGLAQRAEKAAERVRAEYEKAVFLDKIQERLVEMTLYEAQKGNSYRIEGLYVEPAITRRLEALGLNDGTVVNVLNRKKHGALIIRVRGTRLALGKHISSNIEVSGCKGEEGERHAFHES